ncbi:hypothetical protein [Streptomyces murinus]|uniref:hypothetical protein n=1 Tax=Streptomyces murinus TaxID=33900 RepID=UPI003F474970
MGKASRSKKERRRKEAQIWDPAAAARDALRDRAASAVLLEDNPYTAAYFAGGTDRVFQEAMWQHICLGLDPAQAWHETAAWGMGDAGCRGPWPHTTQLIADYAVWERDQQLALLRDGDICVVSPAAHAAVIAAALTVDATDLLTLDRDIPLHAAVVVMPEPIVLNCRNVALCDLSVLGWRHITSYGPAGEEYVAVEVSAMLRPDGPLHTPAWGEFLAEAQAGGYPTPPWFPAGTNGVRADASTRSPAAHAEAIARIRTRHMLHSDVADLIRGDDDILVPDTAQWNGEPIPDPCNDFAERYLFAFWRLAAQGVTTTTATPPPSGPAHQPSHGSTAARPDTADIRLVDLRRTTERSSGTDTASGPRHYTHRWPVRMHKVNQWYPSLGRHKIRWRGPYIQGPADALLRVKDSAYHLSI